MRSGGKGCWYSSDSRYHAAGSETPRAKETATHCVCVTIATHYNSILTIKQSMMDGDSLTFIPLRHSLILHEAPLTRDHFGFNSVTMATL